MEFDLTASFRRTPSFAGGVVAYQQTFGCPSHSDKLEKWS